MYQNCLFLFEKADIAIMSAAVADYKPKQVAEAKIKKNELLWSLELERTHDILKALGQKKTVAQFLVGFALETDHGIENAIQKLRNKNLDLIVLNQLSDAGAGFMHDTNKVTLIDADEKTQALPLKSKKEVAADIAETIAGLLFRKTQ